VVGEFVVLNQYGIHVRPASLFCRIASRYDAEITVEKDGNSVSGKSMMGLMTLEAGKGAKLKVIADGEDAEAAVDELGQLIRNTFGEE
jgi:phosphocarrier protein HPr